MPHSSIFSPTNVSFIWFLSLGLVRDRNVIQKSDSFLILLVAETNVQRNDLGCFYLPIPNMTQHIVPLQALLI